MGLVFMHNHPGEAAPRFSRTDDDGERLLSAFLRHRIPDSLHLAVLVTERGVHARVLGSRDPLRVIEVGIRRRVLFDPATPGLTRVPEYDRQVRAFGADSQRSLSELSVAIVGLGGTGSLVAQELVHLGVKRFTLIDPDVVDSTSLNRLANATGQDVGNAKTEVASRYIKAVSPTADVNQIQDDVMRSDVATNLFRTDFIFGCTDSHGSRSVLQQVAYQYLVPCIDMGSTIVVSSGKITHIHGRVQMLAPGLPCLTCSGLIDPDEVRRDMMTSLEKQSDPYVVGVREPAPAVMSLNGTVASLAITMFLQSTTSIVGNVRHLLYNAISQSLRVISPKAQPDCFICSPRGALARGASAPLMARQD
jgi:molybdopterin/thiamine biosynthesis adenylyltransferase